MIDMHNARRVMVDNQIRTFDVTDRALLNAFELVPREAFVGPQDRGIAYADRVLMLGAGDSLRVMLPPLILARLLQALQPQAGEHALDVLSGTGYPAAILAALGLEATVIEANADMAETAKAALKIAQSPAVVAPVQHGMGAKAGAKFPAESFDVILVNGASEQEPSGFFPLLREGGRLGILHRDGNAARALVYLKANGHVSPRRAFDAQAPVLPGFAAEPGFVF
jgi:protein-L-isoaspartate(D-aspartate) O-methyltransferase